MGIHGRDRVTGVTTAKVDEHMRPIPGTEREWACDTVILSVGLIPENELSQRAGIALDPRTGGAVVDEALQTEVPGFFAAGNVLHVHDLVDFVSAEAETMADRIADYLGSGALPACQIQVKAGEHVHHVLPQCISGTAPVELSLRVDAKLKDVTLTASSHGRVLKQKKLRKALPA